MISFRYHVVSLLTALLALAAGIAVGGGPLQRTDTDSSPDRGQARALAGARSQLDEAKQSSAFDDAYAAATAGALLDGRLEGRAVTLIGLPGAEATTSAELTDLVEVAGGAVTARISLGEKLLDVADRQLVAELATQMQASARAVRVEAGATGYERFAALLAHAVVSDDPAGSPVDDAGESILAGLSTAELLTTDGDLESRGSLVLVVSGAPYGTEDDRAGAGSILGVLLRELDARSSGAVLAGPAQAGAPDGLVGLLRADPAGSDEVSSVDAADRVGGQVAAVLALAAEADGTTGHYGRPGSPDGALPTLGGGTGSDPAADDG